MKTCKKGVALSLLLLIIAGCGPDPQGSLPVFTQNDVTAETIDIYARYTPARIEIIPLTAIENSKIRVYVRLLDQFDSQIKAPGTFRFELFELVYRSAEPRGRRVAFWPGIELNDPVQNNEYWADFIRAYLFEFPFDSQPGQSYIIDAFYTSPRGDERLTSSLRIEP